MLLVLSVLMVVGLIFVKVLFMGVNMVNLLLLSVLMRFMLGLSCLFMVEIRVVSIGLFDVVMVMGFWDMFWIDLVLFGIFLV